MRPGRVQLRRTRGWRKPPGAVVVARPTRWGNPYSVAEHGQEVLATLLLERTAAEARQAAVMPAVVDSLRRPRPQQ